MAAIDTFDWLVQQQMPKPGDAEKAVIDDRRRTLLKMRSENDRRRYTKQVLEEIRLMQLPRK